MSLSRFADAPAGYGRVSRLLHWSMAILFACQFVAPVLYVLAEDSPIEVFFWSTHVSVGTALCVLALVRGVWGLANLSRRPRREGSRLRRRLAGFVHLTLYALMIAVPGLAIVRALGGEWGFTVFGVQLLAPGGEQVPALVEPGNLLHGPLAWVLLALIAGHVAMALWHGLIRRDATLERMTRGAGAHSLRAATERP